MILLHIAAAKGLVLILAWRVKLLTIGFGLSLHVLTGVLGVTAGAHRLWSHRTYKAKFPLQVLLAIFFTMAFQNSIFVWARDHRVHHKFSDTDADPHNSKRGFFFSHMGWLLVRKHPLVLNQGRKVDMSDLKTDPLVMFQHSYYVPLGTILGFILPAVIPWLLWEETLLGAFLVCGILRYVIVLHTTWSVNSAAHLWGMQPYDKNIQPRENIFVAICAGGEGWHNYHHVFPWDYRTGEIGGNRPNVTAKLIDLFEWMGWAYDLKTVPESVIAKRAARSGDRSTKPFYFSTK